MTTPMAGPTPGTAINDLMTGAEYLFSGDTGYRVLYAGESCQLIHDIKPAAQIVRDMVHEAEEVIERLPRG